MLTDEQIENRKKGLGGSDAAAAAGLSEFKTRYELWAEKLGMSKPKPTNDRMKIGSLLEPLVLEKFIEITGFEALKDNTDYEHPKYPWMIAHVDGRIKDNTWGVECKTVLRFDDKWGPSGSDYFPTSYCYQCQHYCTVLGLDGIYLVVYNYLNEETRLYKYRSNPKFEENLIKMEDQFWNQNIKYRIPPTPQTPSDFVNNKAYLNPDEITFIDEEIEMIIAEYNKHKKARDTSLESMEECKMNLLTKMDKASSIIDLSGRPLVTFSRYDMNRLDTKKFKQELPDIYKKYTIQTECSKLTIGELR